jgi:hypothetical protein
MSKAEVCLNVRADVTRPDDTARREALLAPLSRDSHARLVEEFDVLRQVEYRPPPQPATPARDSLKIVVWNAERGKFLDDSARLLRAVGADANLLSEFDLGMARSGQLHTARQLAGKLDQGYVFAVESNSAWVMRMNKRNSPGPRTMRACMAGLSCHRTS